MRLYFAGPLFTQAEREWNRRVTEGLRQMGHDVFLPQEEVKAIATLDANTIFRLDVQSVRSAEVVVAVLDGADPDSGTSFECGMAYALGIPILALRTDFRAGGDGLPGQHLNSVNLMLSQSAIGFVVMTDPSKTEEALIRSLGELLAKIGSRGR